MKYIKKKRPPAKYTTWRRRVAGTADNHFEHGLRHPEKGILKDALLDEQGYICAYTMKRINRDSSHIEHIKPESLCRKEKVGSDLDYTNMVACFPRDGMESPYRYGAPAKDNRWDEGGKNFISPLHRICEQRFSFDMDGNIRPKGGKGGHIAAKKTIALLKLDHKSLTEDRKNAITEYIYGAGGKNALSPTQIIRAIQIICERDHSNQFTQFCVAIHHALLEFQHRENKRKIQKAAINKALLKNKNKK
jgi:uncharacterized protein (TIGR02646 family)